MSFASYANGFQAVPRLGLDRIADLLHRIGDPQRSLRCIHIAGTNGKGSVSMFLDAILRKEGFRTGRYLSPNLKRVNERISVDGVEIDDLTLNSLLSELEGAAEQTKQATGVAPTPFEIWTAAAFCHFANVGCDYVVLEVGMGGRFDATNVIESCAASVITRLDLDHTSYLGSTLAEIAENKCGIIKEACPVIALSQEREAMEVIERTANALHAPLFIAKAPPSLGFTDIYETVSLEGVGTVTLSLGGLHQIENAAIACQTARALGISAESIRYGLSCAVHPARFERLSDAPAVIYDGGHNPNGITALVNALERYFPSTRQTIVFACMKDKDFAPSLRLLDNGRRRFVFTTVQNNPRAMTAEELAAAASEIGIHGEYRETLREARALAEGYGDLVVICGSLYLYSDL